MKQGERRVYCGDARRTSYAEQYRLLLSRLSPEELVCISHCAVFSDCATDGDCELQDKVTKIIGK